MVFHPPFFFAVSSTTSQHFPNTSNGLLAGPNDTFVSRVGVKLVLSDAGVSPLSVLNA